MNGKQRAAVAHRAAQAESEEYAKDMDFFVDEGAGSLLVGDDQPVAVPDSVPSEALVEASEVTIMEPAISKNIVLTTVKRADIERRRAEYAAITFDTKEGYEQGRLAIAFCRSTRGDIADREAKLKGPHLAFLESVRGEARAFVALISEIEEPLKKKRDAVDEAKAKARREKEEAEKAALEAEARAKLEAEATEARLKREAEQAELDRQRAELEAEKAELARQRAEAEARDKAEREAREAAERAEKAKRDEAARIESERVAAAQKVESDRLAAIAAEQAAERERLAAESRKLKAAQEFAERQEFERTTKLRLEAEAKAQAERNRVEAEKERAAAEARRVAEQARVEALRPDTVKLRAFATALRAVPRPALKAVEAQAMLEQVESVLEDATLALEAFGGEVKEAAASAAE